VGWFFSCGVLIKDGEYFSESNHRSIETNTEPPDAGDQRWVSCILH
jgi:hypothetical protein